MKAFAHILVNKHQGNERSTSSKGKKIVMKHNAFNSKSPSKCKGDKVSYKVGTYDVEVILKSSTYLLIIDCFVPKLGMHYSGVYVPQIGIKPSNKSSQSVSESILKKNAKFALTNNECKITAGSAVLKLKAHNDYANKENRPHNNFQLCSSSKKNTPLSSRSNTQKELPPEIFEIKRDIKECKSNYEELREGFKEIKDMMHKTLDQQSSIKTEQQLKEKYNFDEISLPTLKEYANNKDRDVPSLSIFPEKIRTSSTKSGSVLSNPNLTKIQETIDIQNKEIISIKEAIKAINNGQLNSQLKIEGQLGQFKRDVHTSLEMIMEILKKVPKTKQEINTLIQQLKKFDAPPTIQGSLVSTHASASKGDTDCLTERTSRDLNKCMERSRNDGCIKKPRCSTVKGSIMRKL